MSEKLPSDPRSRFEATFSRPNLITSPCTFRYCGTKHAFGTLISGVFKVLSVPWSTQWECAHD